MNRLFLFLSCLLPVLAACKKDKGYPADLLMNTSGCDTANIRYDSKIGSMVQQNCVSCHYAGSSYSNLSTYSTLKPFARAASWSSTCSAATGCWAARASWPR